MHSLVSETIWNCREIDENNLHLKHALLRYLKRFGAVSKDENMKTRTFTRAI